MPLAYNEHMLSAAARKHLTVVLVGARNPQNIGAAARAMQDFGFTDLRVVNAFAPPFEAAQMQAKSAVGADEVMRSARLFSSLPEAVGDCTLVGGTTAIGGRELKQTVLPLRDAAPILLTTLTRTAELSHEATATSGRVALLFGSEKTGLTNEQLSFCSLLLTIPLFAPGGRHLSMNLGQAVAVCLYELSREGLEGARPIPALQQTGATAADRERLSTLLFETMQASEYARRFPANARPEVVRQLAGALGSTRDHAATWMGLFKLILRKLDGKSDNPQP